MLGLKQSAMRSLLFLFLGLGAVFSAAVWATPARVVSQTVGTDEILLAVAGPEQIAALSHLAHSPEFSGAASEAAHYPSIPQGDAETILRYYPTLVLFADYSRVELVEQVRSAGVETLVFDRYTTIDDVHDYLLRLAAVLGPGARSRAEHVVATDRARLAMLHEKLARAKPVRVIAPSTYGVIAGSGTTFQDLCEHAAAENLAASIGSLRGHVSPPAEQMIGWPVDFVVLAGKTAEGALEPFRRLPPYRFMAAIREGRAVVVPEWMLGCVSHRRVDAYELLARALHPELFKD